MFRRVEWWLLIVLAWSSPGAGPRAQDPPPASSAPAPKINLTQEQQAILRDYEGFEKRLAELAEALRGSDLDRANLLFQARSESQRQQVHARMAEIVAILTEQRPYADAVERQKLVVEQLEAILKILQTDAERDRLQARIQELEAILRETNRVIGAQKDVRAETERGGKFGDLQRDEERVRKSAGDLADRIDEQDRARQGGEPRSGEDVPPREGQPAPGEAPPTPEAQPPQPGEAAPLRPPSGEQPPSAPRPGEPSPSPPTPGQPREGSPNEGQPSPPSPRQPSPSPPGQPQGEPRPQERAPAAPTERTPGREELEQALRNMERAIEELKNQNRDGASNEQDQAIAQLERMKAQIEEILRQLREEERELHLTMLEARFQEMLKLQLRINADTVRLDARPAAERGEAHFTKSRDLSRQELQNVLAAERALMLLKEEGSSVAFPEAVDQMRSNMAAVADRLVQGDTGETTQLLERLIVESLEEMILALQQELEKIKQQQQQQTPQQSQPQDPRLVDILAELKMIRSLQNQVNRLTRQIGLDIEGEQAEDPNTLQLLQDLARRQQRIQEATYDLATGRNQ